MLVLITVAAKRICKRQSQMYLSQNRRDVKSGMPLLVWLPFFLFISANYSPAETSLDLKLNLHSLNICSWGVKTYEFVHADSFSEGYTSHEEHFHWNIIQTLPKRQKWIIQIRLRKKKKGKKEVVQGFFTVIFLFKASAGKQENTKATNIMHKTVTKEILENKTQVGEET